MICTLILQASHLHSGYLTLHLHLHDDLTLSSVMSCFLYNSAHRLIAWPTYISIKPLTCNPTLNVAAVLAILELYHDISVTLSLFLPTSLIY